MNRPFDVRVRGHDVVEAGHLVRRLLPSAALPMVGPFVLFDHFGPATLAPGEGVEIAPHLHAHLATVTYFFAGGTHHSDDLGNDVVVEAGDVAWMHAGAGIVHAERTPSAFRARGGVGHGIQAWTALPEELERSAPRYQWARAADIPCVVRGGVTARVLVGEAFGVRSPIETVTSVLLVELRAEAVRAELVLDPAPGQHALLFVDGYGALDGHRIGVGTLVRLCEGVAPRLTLEAGATALFFGGAPLGPRYLQGNVIGSSVERLEQALREANDAPTDGRASALLPP
ncbi:MAG: pirin family protein [Sandaracinus sp.]